MTVKLKPEKTVFCWRHNPYRFWLFKYKRAKQVACLLSILQEWNWLCVAPATLLWVFIAVPGCTTTATNLAGWQADRRLAGLFYKPISSSLTRKNCCQVHCFHLQLLLQYNPLLCSKYQWYDQRETSVHADDPFCSSQRSKVGLRRQEDAQATTRSFSYHKPSTEHKVAMWISVCFVCRFVDVKRRRFCRCVCTFPHWLLRSPSLYQSCFLLAWMTRWPQRKMISRLHE